MYVHNYSMILLLIVMIRPQIFLGYIIIALHHFLTMKDEVIHLY